MANPGASMTEWLTAREIAELRLPGMPTSKRGVNMMAAAEGWKEARDWNGNRLCRVRAGRNGGGGVEYHVSLLDSFTKATRVTVHEETDADYAVTERLRRIDRNIRSVFLQPNEMAVINRVAMRLGISTELLLLQVVRRAVSLIEVAA